MKNSFCLLAFAAIASPAARAATLDEVTKEFDRSFGGYVISGAEVQTAKTEWCVGANRATMEAFSACLASLKKKQDVEVSKTEIQIKALLSQKTALGSQKSFEEILGPFDSKNGNAKLDQLRAAFVKRGGKFTDFQYSAWSRDWTSDAYRDTCSRQPALPACAIPLGSSMTELCKSTLKESSQVSECVSRGKTLIIYGYGSYVIDLRAQKMLSDLITKVEAKPGVQAVESGAAPVPITKPHVARKKKPVSNGLDQKSAADTCELASVIAPNFGAVCTVDPSLPLNASHLQMVGRLRTKALAQALDDAIRVEGAQQFAQTILALNPRNKKVEESLAKCRSALPDYAEEFKGIQVSPETKKWAETRASPEYVKELRDAGNVLASISESLDAIDKMPKEICEWVKVKGDSDRLPMTHQFCVPEPAYQLLEENGTQENLKKTASALMLKFPELAWSIPGTLTFKDLLARGKVLQSEPNDAAVLRHWIEPAGVKIERKSELGLFAMCGIKSNSPAPLEQLVDEYPGVLENVKAKYPNLSAYATCIQDKVHSRKNASGALKSAAQVGGCLAMNVALDIALPAGIPYWILLGTTCLSAAEMNGLTSQLKAKDNQIKSISNCALTKGASRQKCNSDQFVDAVLDYGKSMDTLNESLEPKNAATKLAFDVLTQHGAALLPAAVMLSSATKATYAFGKIGKIQNLVHNKAVLTRSLEAAVAANDVKRAVAIEKELAAIQSSIAGSGANSLDVSIAKLSDDLVGVKTLPLQKTYGLNPEEAKALVYYHGDPIVGGNLFGDRTDKNLANSAYSMFFNKRLRNGNLSELDQEAYKNLVSGYRKLPNYEGKIYRGAFAQEEYLAKLSEKKAGDVFEFEGPSSATSKVGVSKDYIKKTRAHQDINEAESGSVLFDITSKRCKKLPLSLPNPARQSEVVCLPGQKFRVIENSLDATGRRVIKLEEID